MKPLGAILLACALAAVPLTILHRNARTFDLSGVAKVIDGDSIIVGNQHVRLSGIDSPDLAQTCRAPNGDVWHCGETAKAELARIIGNEIISCRHVDSDRYGRLIAICHVGEIDIGQAMVNAGYAVAYTKFSDRYSEDEKIARLTRRGIWQSEFVRPDIWRMQKRGGNGK